LKVTAPTMPRFHLRNYATICEQVLRRFWLKKHMPRWDDNGYIVLADFDCDFPKKYGNHFWLQKLKPKLENMIQNVCLIRPNRLWLHLPRPRFKRVKIREQVVRWFLPWDNGIKFCVPRNRYPIIGYGVPLIPKIRTWRNNVDSCCWVTGKSWRHRLRL
jgi:hypothetical protein